MRIPPSHSSFLPSLLSNLRSSIEHYTAIILLSWISLSIEGHRLWVREEALLPVLGSGNCGMSLKKTVHSDDKLLESSVTNGGNSELFFFFFLKYNSCMHASKSCFSYPPTVQASISIQRWIYNFHRIHFSTVT